MSSRRRSRKMPAGLLARFTALKGKSVELDGRRLAAGPARGRVLGAARRAVRSVAPRTRHAMVRFNPSAKQPPALRAYWAKKRPKARRVELDGRTEAPGRRRGKILRRTRAAVRAVVAGTEHGAVRFNPRTVVARANPAVPSTGPLFRLQQATAAFLRSTGELRPGTRFRMTSRGGLQVTGIRGAALFQRDGNLGRGLAELGHRYGYRLEKGGDSFVLHAESTYATARDNPRAPAGTHKVAAVTPALYKSHLRRLVDPRVVASAGAFKRRYPGWTHALLVRVRERGNRLGPWRIQRYGTRAALLAGGGAAVPRAQGQAAGSQLVAPASLHVRLVPAAGGGGGGGGYVSRQPKAARGNPAARVWPPGAFERPKELANKAQFARAQRAWDLLVAGKIDQDEYTAYVVRGKLPGGKRLPAAPRKAGARANPAARKRRRAVPVTRPVPARVAAPAGGGATSLDWLVR